jgi:tetratricopeptide (TPR) repeat protein
VSSDTASRLDRAVLGEPVGPGQLLAARPDAPETFIPKSDLSGLALETCVPVALRRQLLSGISEPEHRVVSVGFLHFLGVDGLLADQGAGPTADAIGEVVATAQRHLDEQGVCFLGSDVYGDGAKLILTAGAPTTSGNDEERLLRALRGLFDEQLPLPIRAGVNRGHVFAGEVGPDLRRTYTVMGDAVNLAARLMQAAAPGQVLATGAVLDRSATNFEVTGLPPFHVKGKSRPVQAYRVGDIVGWKRDTGRRLPLVGRATELARIMDAATRTREGRGQAILLVGPAGIGKTRLVQELRSQLEGFRQYWIACEQYEMSTAYWPFMLLVRRMLDIPLDADPSETGPWLERYVRDMVPDLLPWLPLLGIVADGRVASTPEVDGLDDAFRQAQLERVTVELLDHLLHGREDDGAGTASPTPIAIFVDDAYWMDEASRGLLRRLEALADERRWLFVVSSRDTDQSLLPEGEPDHARVLRLAPLTAEEMHTLASVATEHAPRSVHQLAAIEERAGGSPLFLLELVGGDTGDDSLPDSIEAAITARIDHLAPPDRVALRCAAVLGRPSFPLRLAEEVLPAHAPALTDPGVWDRLAEFVTREAHDRVRFQHVLIRDVAYEGLAYRRRREIHGAVADWVERETGDPDDQAELLALHTLRAERFAQAFNYSRVAGDRARAKAATADAAASYRQALEAARRGDGLGNAEVIDVAEALGEVSELAGIYDEGARAYRLARRLVREDPVRRADLLRKEGFISERAARYRHARLLYRAGLVELDRVEATSAAVRVRAKLEVVIAAALMWEGRLRASIWWARRAAARAEEAGFPDVLGHAYYRLDAAYTDLGVTPSEDYRARALPMFEELGDLVMQANVLNNLGANAYYEGHWEEAVAYYERSRRTREKAGDLVEAATAASNIAEVLCQQGHPDQAEPLFREALRVFQGAGYGAGIAWVEGYLGLVAARQGRTDEGRALLRRSRESCRDLGMEGLALEASVRLVEVSLLASDPVEAASLSNATRAAVEARGGLPYLEAMLERLHVHIVALRGDLDGALRAIDVSIHRAETAEAPYEVALCLDTKARLSELAGRADDHARERADAILDELGATTPPRVPLPEPTSVVEHVPSTSR